MESGHVHAPNFILGHALISVCLFLGGLYCNELDTSASLLNSALIGISYLATLFASIALYRLVFHRLTRARFPEPIFARLTKLWHVWACRRSKNHLILAELNRKYGDFVRTALMQYENTTLKYIDQLDCCIKADAVAHRFSEATDLFYWLGFDTMGEFVFDKSFGMLRNQQWHYIVLLLQRALSLLGPFSPAPWLVQVGFKLLPRVGILRDWFDMVAWCEKQMRETIEAPNDNIREPDVAQPTASALVGIFYELARNPDHAQKIHDGLQSLDVHDAKLLSKLPHLDGCIAEALRLYPALPTGGNRKTPEQGVLIGGRYIPPQTTVVAPPVFHLTP
ncbi:MAG: hypothetical protein Q9187_004266 [Circinaria calcarea]